MVTEPKLTQARAARASSILMLIFFRIPAALVAAVIELANAASGWARARLGPLAAGLAEVAGRAVTPVRTVGVVAAAAAVALAASQFIDYRAVAVGLIVATARGRWRLGRAVGVIGVAGIAIGLLSDAPQGLEAGSSAVAYLGTDPRLIEGFWAQIAASAALLFCGPLLGLYAKQAASEPRRARSARRDRLARRSPARSTAGARGRLKAGT